MGERVWGWGTGCGETREAGWSCCCEARLGCVHAAVLCVRVRACACCMWACAQTLVMKDKYDVLAGASRRAAQPVFGKMEDPWRNKTFDTHGGAAALALL